MPVVVEVGDVEKSCLVELGPKPPAWRVLAEAVAGQRSVVACYHGRLRLLCPHVLGWRAGRAKLFALQVAGTASRGPLPGDDAHCWRSFFVDEIEAVAACRAEWRSAGNYRACSAGTGMDTVVIAVPAGGTL